MTLSVAINRSKPHHIVLCVSFVELTASSLAATRSIVWQSVSLSDLDYQSDDSEARIYECRCGHKTVIDEDVVDQLNDGPVRIPCLGCSFGLELSGD